MRADIRPERSQPPNLTASLVAAVYGLWMLAFRNRFSEAALATVTPELIRVTRNQGGAFSYEQACRLGIPRAEIRGALERGHLFRLLPMIYSFAGTPQDQRLLSHAALLQYGPQAALSHGSAGARWKLTGPARRVEITIPHGHRLSRSPGWLGVHRTRHPQIGVLDGTRITPVARTLCDLAGTITATELSAVLLAAVQKRVVSVEEIVSTLDRIGPRRGSTRLRRQLAEYDPGFESHLSKEFWRLVVAAGYPQAQLCPVIDLLGGRTARPDVALMALGLGFEADGMGPHGAYEAQLHDKRRDRALLAVGWQIARFTIADIRHHPQRTIAEIRRIVQAREAELGRAA